MRITLVALALVGCWRSTDPPPVQPVVPRPAPVGGSGYGGAGYAAFAGDPGCPAYKVGCGTTGFVGGHGYGGAIGYGGSGTIRTGRYGTIGHSSGSGNGYGIGRGRTPASTILIGQPNVQGDLDKAIIRRYIKRNQMKLLYCYEKQLLARPAIAGTIATMFVIGADGKVTKSDASGVDPDVASCVAAVIQDIEFPKPTTPADVLVAYPFTFRPPGP